MWRLILINFNKKLSYASMIITFVSLIAIYLVAVFNASFNVNGYMYLEEKAFLIKDFFQETFLLVELIGIIFVVLVVELELFYNTDNFDSYFVSVFGKEKFIVSKIYAYLLIILNYTVLMFLGITIIYFMRFNSIEYIKFIIDGFYHYTIYFSLVFLIAFIFVLSFKNYFSAMIVFIYYWLSKIFESNTKLVNIIFPKIIIDLDKYKISFGVDFIYILFGILFMFVTILHTYRKLDLKVS